MEKIFENHCKMLPLLWVAGVDGCRGGWFVVLIEIQQGITGQSHHMVCPSFRDVCKLVPAPGVIAVDVPIGLLDQPQPGGRDCDKEARHLLGRGRASSVFTPPIRPLLNGAVRPPGMTKQTFGILPKIREVDALITPQLQDRVYEIHPEVSFKALAGRSMRHKKTTARGRDERLEALSEHFHSIGDTLQHITLSGVSRDDVLDAYAASWTATRIVNRQAQCLPDKPPRDARGLRMEIRY